MNVGRAARRLASEFWPGPLTLVFECGTRFADGVARADGAIGVRCSSHPVAAALARRLAQEGIGPITSTSLNRHGEPPADSRTTARALCAPGLAGPRLFDLEGAEAGGFRESTVVDVTGDRPQVLRWGGLPKPVLEPVLKEIADS
jgi:L-threonylcarbamoyladenylate synthase